jgi:hypothetical protein
MHASFTQRRFDTAAGKARDRHLPPYRWPHTAFRLGPARDNSRMVGYSSTIPMRGDVAMPGLTMEELACGPVTMTRVGHLRDSLMYSSDRKAGPTTRFLVT